MTEIQYELIPDQCRVYPIYADDFSAFEHAEVNSTAWTARIDVAGKIASVTDAEGNMHTSFEELDVLGIEGFKLVCEHEVEMNE